MIRNVTCRNSFPFLLVGLSLVAVSRYAQWPRRYRVARRHRSKCPASPCQESGSEVQFSLHPRRDRVAALTPIGRWLHRRTVFRANVPDSGPHLDDVSAAASVSMSSAATTTDLTCAGSARAK